MSGTVETLLNSNVVAGVVVLLLGWFFGSRVTGRWELRKRQRELDLVVAGDFYAAYGEFFAVWKEWDSVLRGKFPADQRQHRRESLFVRACTAEGRVEALLVKLATERQLSRHEARLLGCFRQGYQTLRKAIQSDRAVGMSPRGSGQHVADEWLWSESPSYVAFKALAVNVTEIIGRSTRRPSATDALTSLREITSNGLEPPNWSTLATSELRAQLARSTPDGKV